MLFGQLVRAAQSQCAWTCSWASESTADLLLSSAASPHSLASPLHFASPCSSARSSAAFMSVPTTAASAGAAAAAAPPDAPSAVLQLSSDTESDESSPSRVLSNVPSVHLLSRADHGAAQATPSQPAAPESVHQRDTTVAAAPKSMVKRSRTRGGGTAGSAGAGSGADRGSQFESFSDESFEGAIATTTAQHTTTPIVQTATAAQTLNVQVGGRTLLEEVATQESLMDLQQLDRAASPPPRSSVAAATTTAAATTSATKRARPAHRARESTRLDEPPSQTPEEAEARARRLFPNKQTIYVYLEDEDPVKVAFEPGMTEAEFTKREQGALRLRRQRHSRAETALSASGRRVSRTMGVSGPIVSQPNQLRSSGVTVRPSVEYESLSSGSEADEYDRERVDLEAESDEDEDYEDEDEGEHPYAPRARQPTRASTRPQRAVPPKISEEEREASYAGVQKHLARAAKHVEVGALAEDKQLELAKKKSALTFIELTQNEPRRLEEYHRLLKEVGQSGGPYSGHDMSDTRTGSTQRGRAPKFGKRGLSVAAAKEWLEGSSDSGQRGRSRGRTSSAAAAKAIAGAEINEDEDVQHAIQQHIMEWSTSVSDPTNFTSHGFTHTATWQQATGLGTERHPEVIEFCRKYAVQLPPPLRNPLRWARVTVQWPYAWRTHRPYNAEDSFLTKVSPLSVQVWYQLTPQPRVPGYILVHTDLMYYLTTRKMTGLYTNSHSNPTRTEWTTVAHRLFVRVCLLRCGSQRDRTRGGRVQPSAEPLQHADHGHSRRRGHG